MRIADLIAAHNETSTGLKTQLAQLRRRDRKYGQKAVKGQQVRPIGQVVSRINRINSAYGGDRIGNVHVTSGGLRIELSRAADTSLRPSR